MKESKEIDYNSKILNFMAMTETGDQDIATKYLESSNWDESIAVNKFYNKIQENTSSSNKNNNKKKIKKNNNIIDSIDNNIINEPINNNIINDYSENLIDKNIENVQKKDIEENENENCLNKYIIFPILSAFNFCFKKGETNIEETTIFQSLPNGDFKQLNEIIKKKIGIIILYKKQNLEFLNRFIIQIKNNSMSLNLIKQKCEIFPLLATTKEGINIKYIISDNPLIYPVFAFCYNPSKSIKKQNIILERKNVINKLEGESISLDSFHSILIDSIDSSENLNNTKLSKNKLENNNINALTDAEILEQQKSDMEALEKEVLKKEEELKNQKLLEKQRKIEEELLKKQEEQKLEELKFFVVEEPSEDNPDVTIISFRYPDGEKRKERRFLKTHTIQHLYDYIKSLGREIFTEEENNGFSLYQPFPPKKYSEMSNTLEKEGLFPNAIIQIREE